MPKPRVVVDTNFWVSYLIFPRGSIERVGDVFAREGAVLLGSPQCLEELREVIGREQWDRYASLDIRLLFFEGVYQRCEIVTPNTTITVCRDARDDKFLELAVDGEADFLVTGDRDLLGLAERPDPTWKFRIVTPKEFIEAIGEG